MNGGGHHAHRRPVPSGRFVVEASEAGGVPSLEEVELRYIRFVLDLSSGNKQQAADLLGVDRRTIYRKLASEREFVPESRVREGGRAMKLDRESSEGRKSLGDGRYEED